MSLFLRHFSFITASLLIFSLHAFAESTNADGKMSSAQKRRAAKAEKRVLNKASAALAQVLAEEVTEEQTRPDLSNDMVYPEGEKPMDMGPDRFCARHPEAEGCPGAKEK